MWAEPLWPYPTSEGSSTAPGSGRKELPWRKGGERMASQGSAGPQLQLGLEGHVRTTQMSWGGGMHKSHLMGGGWDGVEHPLSCPEYYPLLPSPGRALGRTGGLLSPGLSRDSSLLPVQVNWSRRLTDRGTKSRACRPRTNGPRCILTFPAPPLPCQKIR